MWKASKCSLQAISLPKLDCLGPCAFDHSNIFKVSNTSFCVIDPPIDFTIRAAWLIVCPCVPWSHLCAVWKKFSRVVFHSAESLSQSCCRLHTIVLGLCVLLIASVLCFWQEVWHCCWMPTTSSSHPGTSGDLGNPLPPHTWRLWWFNSSTMTTAHLDWFCGVGQIRL